MCGLRFQSFLLYFCALTALGTTACLDRKQAVITGASRSTATAAVGFTGATSAANLPNDGLSIQINWNQAAAPYTHYNVYLLNADGSLTKINTVYLPLSQTSYTQVGLVSGMLYNFVVREVKDDGTDDGNKVAVAAMAYSGINQVGGATSVNLNSATINFPAVGTLGDGVQVNCSNTAGTAQASQTVHSQTATSVGLTGLMSGTTYVCTANAIYAGLNGVLQNDSNAAKFSFQTISIGYAVTSPPYISLPNNKGAYQGVILVQAYGDAPSAPVASTAPAAIASPVPVVSTRQVSITWKSFTGVQPMTAQYRLVRVQEGGVFNMNTSAPCSAAMTTSCQVCLSTAGQIPVSRTCIDNTLAIAKSPARYDYAVSLIVNPNSIPPLAEELPSVDAPYRINVPIPPDNMVLVHRDSANYEICNYMGLMTDPLNNQRCSYNGLGAIPYNSGSFGSAVQMTLKGKLGSMFPGVVNGGNFYDFGYNLFIDRWEMGCNWTPGPTTVPGGAGMCGLGATPQDCFGAGPPLAGIGVNGNVYYNMTNGGMGNTCYQKISGIWVEIDGMSSVAPSLIAATATNVPSMSVQKPPVPFYFTSAVMGPLLCQSYVDPNYGPKHLMTRRERIPAAAFQWLPGEPNQQTSSSLIALQAGANLPSSLGCNNSSHSGVAVPGVMNTNEAFPAAANKTLMIGSHYTTNCVSRFGAQDMVGNGWEFTNDIMTCTAATHSCTLSGGNGNNDYGFLETYAFNNPLTNTGPGGTVPSGYNDGVYGQFGWKTALGGAGLFFNQNISVPLGMPFFTANDHGNAIPVSSIHAEDDITNNISVDYPQVNRYILTDTRFYILTFAGISAYNAGAVRCALPAE